jgi:hypothetical protein
MTTEPQPRKNSPERRQINQDAVQRLQMKLFAKECGDEDDSELKNKLIYFFNQLS